MTDAPRRTWRFRDRDWEYDEDTSREIDERVARAKEQQLQQLTDLEWYDHIQGEEADLDTEPPLRYPD